MLSLMAPIIIVEIDPVLGILDKDNEGWTLVTRWRPRKQRHVQPPSLPQRKRQGRRMSHQQPTGKKRYVGKKYEVQPVDLLEHEPLVPVTLEEFFSRDLFKKVVVNMVPCSSTRMMRKMNN